MNAEPMLRTRDVVRTFGAGEAQVNAVDGVSLEIREGELVLIMGPSGSGKTTLLTMIGGLLRPTSGAIELGGRDIAGLSPRELEDVRCHTIGFIFQSFNLWESLSVTENVELALNIAGVKGDKARERAKTLLDERGLSARASFKSRDLSGGEKQRLSIARALANQPRIILADEPTANLDSRHGHEVMRLLRDIAKSGGKAVLVVSHDDRIREVADRVLWLEDGRIKDMSRLARDPVCGMSLEEDGTRSLSYGGTRYYFCSRGCADEFEADPSKFTAGAAAGD